MAKAVKEFWKTYLVLAVAAGLGAYVYLVEMKREDAGKDGKPKEKVLAFDKAKARALTLEARGAEAVRVEKQAEAWRLTAPVAVPADGAEVDGILSTLAGLEMDEVVLEAPKDLAEFGLLPPRRTVTVLLEGAKEPAQLLLGEKTPDGNALYAKVPARPRVFTIPSYLEGTVDKKPFDLRDRSVLHVQRDAVRTLEITGPEGSYALARSDKGEWAFTRPLATPAGRWAVDSFLGTLENLRMESVAAEDAKDLTPFGLDKPARTVTAGLSDGSAKTLEIGGKVGEDKYHAREAGRTLVAVIPKALVEDLAKGMGELRARRLLDVATYDVVGFDVLAAGAKKTYARSTSKDPKEGFDVYHWKRTAPDGKEVATSKVQDTLFLIGGLEVLEFVDQPAAPATYGLDTPTLEVALRYQDKPQQSFALGERDGAFYARRSGDASVLRLDPAKAAEMKKAFGEL